MSTTAEFLGEIAHGNHTDLLAVLFAKECHSTGLFGFFLCHDLCYDRQMLCDLGIYHILDLL